MKPLPPPHKINHYFKKLVLINSIALALSAMTSPNVSAKPFTKVENEPIHLMSNPLIPVKNNNDVSYIVSLLISNPT